MEFIKKLSLILTIIGALNWGLIGLFGFDLVAFIFGPMSYLTQVVYIVVGLSAIVVIFSKCPCIVGTPKK